MSLLIDVLISIAQHRSPVANTGVLSPGQPLKLLLVGYNGIRNTGADARVHALVNQLTGRFGDAIDITVMTLDAQITRRMFGSATQLGFTEAFFRSRHVQGAGETLYRIRL